MASAVHRDTDESRWIDRRDSRAIEFFKVSPRRARGIGVVSW